MVGPSTAITSTAEDPMFGAEQTYQEARLSSIESTQLVVKEISCRRLS